MPSSEFVPNNVWGSAAGVGAEEELTLPSGQTCRARKMSIENVIQSGLVSQVDILTTLVDKYTRQVKGGNKVVDGMHIDKSLLTDTQALTTIIGLADRLMPAILVSPIVLLHFTEQTVGKTTVTKAIPADERLPGAIYTDMIDLPDKMHLFNWAMGGLEQFSSFRRETDGDVGTVAPVAGRKKSAKRRSRDR